MSCGWLSSTTDDMRSKCGVNGDAVQEQLTMVIEGEQWNWVLTDKGAITIVRGQNGCGSLFGDTVIVIMEPRSL